MTVLDAYAVLALLRDEPAAADVASIVDDDPQASLTPLGAAEVIDQLIRISDADPATAVLDLAQLGLADPEPLEPQTALRAGLLRAKHYRRRRCEISLADCVAAESARTRGSPLATADPDLLTTCDAEGIDMIVLPDSAGTRWSPRGTDRT